MWYYLGGGCWFLLGRFSSQGGRWERAAPLTESRRSQRPREYMCLLDVSTICEGPGGPGGCGVGGVWHHALWWRHLCQRGAEGQAEAQEEDTRHQATERL